MGSADGCDGGSSGVFGNDGSKWKRGDERRSSAGGGDGECRSGGARRARGGADERFTGQQYGKLHSGVWQVSSGEL